MATRGQLRNVQRAFSFKRSPPIVFGVALCWLLLGPGSLPLWAQSPSPDLPHRGAPDSAPSPWPLLQTGDSGEAVRQLQAELRRIGVLAAPMDGQYGPTTEAAVREFQRSQGLTPDGVVGVQTWQALALAQNPIGRVDFPALTKDSLLAFTPLTFSQPPPPPSPFWLVLMPLIPLAGGALTYLQRRLMGRQPIKTFSTHSSSQHSRHDCDPRH